MWLSAVLAHMAKPTSKTLWANQGASCCCCVGASLPTVHSWLVDCTLSFFLNQLLGIKVTTGRRFHAKDWKEEEKAENGEKSLQQALEGGEFIAKHWPNRQMAPPQPSATSDLSHGTLTFKQKALVSPH